MLGTTPNRKRQAELRGEPRGRLRGRAVLVSGVDSRIDGAVAMAFAREGADVAVAYFNDHRTAEEIRQSVLREGSRCILMSGDTANATFCRFAVRKTLGEFGRLDILVNDTGRLQRREMSKADTQDLFRATLMGMFHLTAVAAPRLEKGGVILNTAAATVREDAAVPAELAAAMTSATLAFTRHLARALSSRRISVNMVAAGAVGASGRAADLTGSHVALAARDTACHPPVARSSR